MKRKIKQILTVLLMAITVVVVFSTAAQAAGTDFPSASSITFDKTYSDSITEQNREDYYKVTLSSSGKVKIDITSYMRYYCIYFYNSNGSEMFYLGGNEAPSGMRADSYSYHLEKGTYYIKINGYYSHYNQTGKYASTGNYNLKLTFTASGATVAEPNNNFAEAKSVSYNTTYKGQIAINDREDYHKITLSSSGKLKIDITSYMQYYCIYLYNSSGHEVWYTGGNEYISGTGMRSDSYSLNLEKDTYYIKIDGYYSNYNQTGKYASTGNYSFKLSFTASGANVAEPNNSITEAKAISFNTTYKGQIAINDSNDYYKITVPSTTKIKINITSYMKYYCIVIYKSDGYQAWKTDYNEYDSTTGKRSDVYEVTLDKGTYYVKINGYKYDSSYASTGNYTFSISDGKLGKTSSLVATPTYNSVKLTWKAVPDATGYRVYQYDYSKGSSDRLLDTTAKSYTRTGLKANTQYRFSVKAYKLVDGKKVFSDVYTIVVTNTLVGKTSKITPTVSTSSVKLTWNKVSGATGYKLFQKVDGKWKTISTTTATTYTFKNLNSGTRYSFAVKAYKKVDSKVTYSNVYTSIGTATKTATPSIKTITSTVKGKVNLTWTNVTGETGFQVYYSTSKDSGYTRYGNFKGNVTKATLSGFTSGKTYYFKIRTYKSSDSGYVYSAFSNVVSVKVK